jgi:NACHT C-terminal Alpha/Beta 2
MIANAYSLIPRAASDVRVHLFELATNDRRRRAAASHLLARIEAWRLERGRPSTEPRHPAFESGTSWPLSLP